MADIKQAANWMKEGKQVRRPTWLPTTPSWTLNPIDDLDDEDASVVEVGCLYSCTVEVSDLLADDWEVAE